MGSRPFHLARARHHLAAADHIATTPEYVDWAVVALFYAAHEQVHSMLSGQPDLPKDERHPRKHTGHGDVSGGRGTNQLVKGLPLLRPLRRDYLDLFEASHRTRYDFEQLGLGKFDGPDVYARFRKMYEHIATNVASINSTRPDVSTQAP